MKIAIITGPRAVTAAEEQLVRAVVRELYARGYTLYVGDAAGVDDIAADQFCRCYDGNSAQSCRVFVPVAQLGRTPAGLAERSTRMVKEALRAVKDGVICVGFPNKPCPAGVFPARTWKSGGSGTWSTLALAIGNGIETWILPLTDSAKLRTNWGTRFDLFLEKYRAMHYTTSPPLFPESAHDALCVGLENLNSRQLDHDELANGWTNYARANSPDGN